MNDINILFFELIRTAIGSQEGLSRLPSNKEWKALYDMAMKQSLVGVCFAGLQRLGADANEGFARIGMSEMLYLTWMGTTAKIQQRNETVNRQCVELQARLTADDMKSSILKGQGLAGYYGDLAALRQSGDIDVWVSGGMKKVFSYALTISRDLDFDYINTVLPVYDDTPVELHWKVRSVSNIFKNLRLQRWMLENQDEITANEVFLHSAHDKIIVPSDRFNRLSLFLHLYTHMFGEGLGFRQVMDYYMFLKSNCTSDPEKKEWLELVKKFSSKKFASAIMWVMGYIFEGHGDYANWMLIKPSRKEGLYILSEMLEGGNFGKYDNRLICNVQNKKVMSMQRRIVHTLRLASHYPIEFINAPLWLVGHFFWKRITKFNLQKQWNKEN